MLTRWKLDTDLAEDGQSAVEKCQNTHYDLILMDLSMPIMNGFAAAREIRKSDTPNKDTPIVGLTAHVGSDVASDCRKAGMTGYIAKPLRMETFKECLCQHIKLPHAE